MPKTIYYFYNDDDRIVITLDGEDIGTWTTLEETAQWIRTYKPNIKEFELKEHPDA